VVRRATPSVFFPKLVTFTSEEVRLGSLGHATQPNPALLSSNPAMSEQVTITPDPDTVLGSDDVQNASRLVLLIDDDEEVVRLLERALSSENYRSMTISAGRGLDFSGLEERPFAIVVDITVPDVDGFEIIPRLNQHPLAQGVPIVMMSTRSGLKDRRTGRSLQNFLTKPFRPSQLLQMLRKFAKDDTEQNQ
jgi:CheY-like chemotaxis protein